MATQPALITAEVRWFYPGDPPTSLIHWLAQDCPGNELEPAEEREDVYLVVPECEYLNIKLRQQRLEIKWRQAELEEVIWKNQNAGQVEKWLKWMCEAPPSVNLIPENVSEASQWVHVKKSRFQRKYQVIDHALNPISKAIQVSQGCTVELTQLILYNHPWWSLAFEAFGQESRLLEILKIALQELSQTYPTFPVESSHSYAYPKWLISNG
jgi:hypothetical protein